jgi:23S rRNA (adenine2503-C2)-methyltransferase
MRAESAPLIARTSQEWALAMTEMGERAFHAKQVFRWLQARGVTDPDAMTDLPVALRAKLRALGLGPVLRTGRVKQASDGTRKILFELHDSFNVESVLIPALRSQDLDADAAAADTDDPEEDGGAPERVRVTQCISTQVGCAMGCVFCASGVAGLKRHMTADEIVSQVLEAKRHLHPNEDLRNVVLMGMGEPLHNYEATRRALELLTCQEGIALSSRRVTVSTSGLVPEIARLGADFQGNIGLAVSLHAADDETRTRLMPINRKYPLAVLMKALRDYPLPKRRRITIEYTLVAGKNDDVAEAKKLVKLLRGLPVKVNLIPMNPIEASTLGPSAAESVTRFQQALIDAGYSCFIRRRRGDDVDAACGQLALLGAKPKVRVIRD